MSQKGCSGEGTQSKLCLYTPGPASFIMHNYKLPNVEALRAISPSSVKLPPGRCVSMEWRSGGGPCLFSCSEHEAPAPPVSLTDEFASSLQLRGGIFQGTWGADLGNSDVQMWRIPLVSEQQAASDLLSCPHPGRKMLALSYKAVSGVGMDRVSFSSFHKCDFKNLTWQVMKA